MFFCFFYTDGRKRQVWNDASSWYPRGINNEEVHVFIIDCPTLLANLPNAMNFFVLRDLYETSNPLRLAEYSVPGLMISDARNNPTWKCSLVSAIWTYDCWAKYSIITKVSDSNVQLLLALINL